MHSHFSFIPTEREPFWNLWVTEMLSRGGAVIPPTPMVHRALAAMPDAPRKPWRVAQYGSGTGRDTRALVGDPRVGSLTAYDFSNAAQTVVADIGVALLGGDAARLVGVRTPFEQLDFAKQPRVDMAFASAAFIYVDEDSIEPVTRGAFSRVVVGGIGCANFAVHSDPGDYGHQPVTGVPIDMLRAWLADSGFAGSITGFGSHAEPLQDGEEPIFYEALVRRRSVRAQPIDGLVIKR